MYTLTINHLLDKKHFDKATIVTGHNGLSNQVKWVHILETIDIEQLIHGNELILTTGIQLKEEASVGTVSVKSGKKVLGGGTRITITQDQYKAISEKVKSIHDNFTMGK